MAKDPVCGMSVDEKTAKLRSEYKHVCGALTKCNGGFGITKCHQHFLGGIRS